jgi:hypothetical protein
MSALLWLVLQWSLSAAAFRAMLCWLDLHLQVNHVFHLKLLLIIKQA